MSIESISISTKISFVLFLLLLIALAAYTIYTYRYTIPQISRGKKIALNLLRFCALFLIAAALIEPVLSLVRKKTEQPVHLVFIDNSTSMRAGDEAKTKVVQGFLDALKSKDIPGNIEYGTFGNSVSPLAKEGLSQIQFDNPVTNFYPVFSGLKERTQNISSITIISDGIATEGADPTTLAETAGIPVFTIGVGDSTMQVDIAITEVELNDIIYAGARTPVRVNINNRGFSNRTLKAKLFEEGVQVDEKSISLTEGINTALLSYTPKMAGEHKLSVDIEQIPGDKNANNNRMIKYVSVRSSKVKVLVVAGSPCADVTYIKQALEADTNITVWTIVELGQNKFLAPYTEKMLDSSAAYFLVQFPSLHSSPQLFAQIKQRIEDGHKPFFLQMGENYSPSMLQQLDNLLPVSVRRNNGGSFPVQPVVQERNSGHPLIGSDAAGEWGNLPPVLRPNVDVIVKPETEQLLTMKTTTAEFEMPLFAVRNIGTQRSAILIAKDIWRWRLLNASPTDLFTKFILANFKWLEAGADRERLIVRTNKKSYAAGEEVKFLGELFDESFNPAAERKIELKISGGKTSSSLIMSPIGNGLYEQVFTPTDTGDYRFTAEAEDGGAKPLQKSGRFSIGEVDPELVNTVTNAGFLKYLGFISNGGFFYNNDYGGLFDRLTRIGNKEVRISTQNQEISLWNNFWLLSAIILLLGAEWFLRKREGML